MSPRHSDILIIGGGIVGSSIAFELTQGEHKEKKIHLLEANTIASQTSSSSSKMLHGGIRYLENMDFYLVFEALREKNYWVAEKPHLAKEAGFYLPVYKESKWPLWAMRVGVFLYNLLSGFRNKHYKSLNKKESLKEFPMLKSKGLRGAAAYSDAIIDDELFCREIADQAQDNGVQIFEQELVQEIDKENSRYIVRTQNHIYTTKELIIACGPYTDKVSKLILPEWQNIILPSKGVHLWIKKESLPVQSNIVLQTKDNRVIFIINHQNQVLVGTTETVLSENEVSFNLKPTESEIDYILKNVNNYLEDKTITRDDIIGSFAGIRPLVKARGMRSSKTSRHHKIYTPKENLYIIAGGKYTTCRVMAKQLVAKLN